MFALITGTTNGIGKSIASKLISKNLKVIGVDKKINKSLKNKNFYPNKLNILDKKIIYNFLSKLKKNKKLPECFILNAGINIYDNKGSFNLENFKKCFDINFFPIVEIIKGLQENLKKNKGSVVLFSTVAVQTGFTNHAIIASAKGAIEGLTKSLAAEFAPNIRVNCIAPSLTNSKMSNFLLKNEKVAEGIAKMHPLKRIGEGSDTASVARFLLTKESSWITGQIVGVDGGRSSVA